jgi:hypothetical protein
MFETRLYASLFLHFGRLVPKGIVLKWEHGVRVLTSADVRHKAQTVIQCYEKLSFLFSWLCCFICRGCLLHKVVQLIRVNSEESAVLVANRTLHGYFFTSTSRYRHRHELTTYVHHARGCVLYSGAHGPQRSREIERACARIER